MYLKENESEVVANIRAFERTILKCFAFKFKFAIYEKFSSMKE